MERARAVRHREAAQLPNSPRVILDTTWPSGEQEFFAIFLLDLPASGTFILPSET